MTYFEISFLTDVKNKSSETYTGYTGYTNKSS